MAKVEISEIAMAEKVSSWYARHFFYSTNILPAFGYLVTIRLFLLLDFTDLVSFECFTFLYVIITLQCFALSYRPLITRVKAGEFVVSITDDSSRHGPIREHVLGIQGSPQHN